MDTPLFRCGLAATLLFGLSACDALEYEPSGEHFVEVQPPTTGIAVDFAESADTLGGWGVVNFRYRLDLGGKRFAFTEVFLNGEPLLTIEDPLQQFTLDTRRIPDGPHVLELVVYAHSGTGSLADRLGGEFVYNRRAKVFVVDNAAPAPLAIQSIRPEEGRLRIVWEPYRRSNFQAYRLFRQKAYYYAEGGLDWGNEEPVAHIVDPAQNAWNDTQFVGGGRALPGGGRGCR